MSAFTLFINNGFIVLILLLSLFFILQEIIAFFKTKKPHHKLFSQGFIFIFTAALLIFLSPRIFKFRSIGYFISGIAGILCFLSAVYFIIKAIKFKE